MDDFYVKEADIYYLITKNGSNLVGKEIAIGFSVCPIYTTSDPDDRIILLHRHGAREIVERWYDESLKKLMAAAVASFAEDLKIISSSEIDPDDINAMIANAKYLGTWLEKRKIKV